MADNITIDTITGDPVAATDDVGGAHYQYVKPAFGADGTATKVSATNPLPVVAPVQTQEDAGIDVNSTATVTTAVALGPNGMVGFQVDSVTGTSATFVITLQVSADNVVFHNTAITLQGEGVVEHETAFAYARCKVTTAEGGTATADVNLQSK